MVPFKVTQVEALEPRSLLTVAATGLRASLAVRPEATTAGTVLVMTFTEKNTSKHDVAIGVGPQVDGFVVERGSAVVWRSNAGIQPALVQAVTLKPGQSFTTKATWDGRSNQGNPDGEEFGPHLRGKFTVTNELAADRVQAKVTLRGKR